MRKFENIQHNLEMVVSTNCFSQIVANLRFEPDGIYAEYLKLSNDKIYTRLAHCFTICLSHGYLPTALIETTIVHIAKNKFDIITDSNNYRLIALAAISLKY